MLDDNLTSGCTALAGTCEPESHRVFPDMRMCGLRIRSFAVPIPCAYAAPLSGMLSMFSNRYRCFDVVSRVLVPAVVLPRLPQCTSMRIWALHGRMKQTVRGATLAAFAGAPAGTHACFSLSQSHQCVLDAGSVGMQAFCCARTSRLEGWISQMCTGSCSMILPR